MPKCNQQTSQPCAINLKWHCFSSEIGHSSSLLPSYLGFREKRKSVPHIYTANLVESKSNDRIIFSQLGDKPQSLAPYKVKYILTSCSVYNIVTLCSKHLLLCADITLLVIYIYIYVKLALVQLREKKKYFHLTTHHGVQIS